MPLNLLPGLMTGGESVALSHHDDAGRHAGKEKEGKSAPADGKLALIHY